MKALAYAEAIWNAFLTSAALHACNQRRWVEAKGAW